MSAVDAFSGKIMKYVDQHALLSPGIASWWGLSGGADSVCLLLILQVISWENAMLSLCGTCEVWHPGAGGAGRYGLLPSAV